MPIDFLHREIRPGDECVYPVRARSKMWMCRATITEVHHDHLMVTRIVPPGTRPIKIKNFDTVCVVSGGA